MQNTDGNVQAPWGILFIDGLKNYQYVITQADTLKDWNFSLLGTVMKAYTTEVLVDLYDQLPYAEGLQGAGDLNPKFNSGDSIYKALLASIDDALSKDFTASSVTDPGTQDLIFGGNMASWVAFANTLKLKMYLRMTNAHPKCCCCRRVLPPCLAAGAPFLDSSTGSAEVTNFYGCPGPGQSHCTNRTIRQLNTAVNLKASVRPLRAGWKLITVIPGSNIFLTGATSATGHHQPG